MHPLPSYQPAPTQWLYPDRPSPAPWASPYRPGYESPYRPGYENSPRRHSPHRPAPAPWNHGQPASRPQWGNGGYSPDPYWRPGYAGNPYWGRPYGYDPVNAAATYGGFQIGASLGASVAYGTGNPKAAGILGGIGGIFGAILGNSITR